MKLLQLRYYQAACQLNSITKAAELLHVSQSSVSMAIKELEAEFEIQLLNRQYRGFTLTQEGVAFLNQVNILLEQAEQSSEIMKDIARKRNLLLLGVPPMIGSMFLPKIYPVYAKRYPHTDVRIVEAGRKNLIRQLEAEELDMIFLPYDEPLGEEYSCIELSSTQTVFCTNKNHPLAQKAMIQMNDLLREPLVMFKDSFFQNERIIDRFRQCGQMPNVVLYTNQLSTIISLIQNGVASGFLLGNIKDSYPDLVSIPLDPPLAYKIGLVWRKDSFLFRDMSHLIACIREVL